MISKIVVLVGVIRFERTTSPSRTVRATELRHTPTLALLYPESLYNKSDGKAAAVIRSS